MAKNDFSVYWKDKNGNRLQTTDTDRSFQSINDLFDSHGNPRYQEDWIFGKRKDTGDDASILVVEHFRQPFAKNKDLSNYTLGVIFKNKEGLPNKESWLTTGKYSMAGTFVGSNRRKIEFDLSQLSDGLVAKGAKGKKTQGVRQFTFIPYTRESKAKDNQQYFGKRVVNITTGPNSYNATPDRTTGTKATSEVKGFSKLKDLQSDKILPGFTVTVGGVANLLLNKGYEKKGGLPDGVDQYKLIVDEKVDTNKKVLNQSILVTYDGKDNGYSSTLQKLYKEKFSPNEGEGQSILLQNDRPWFVSGSKNGIIDSRIKSDEDPTNNDEEKFYNAALELQSSFKAKGSDNTLKNRAISVQGVTFKDNAKNNQSAIQLNGYNKSGGSYDWYLPTQPKNPNKTYWERIKLAIDNYVSGNSVVNYENQGGSNKTNSPVYMFDNQIFAWADGSDGPETLAPNSLFMRNVQMTADDNIKVLSKNSSWQDITLIQGNTGSAVSLGSYGLTNGAVTGNALTNISVPRIAQYYPFDLINGVISNKSIFGKPLQSINSKKNNFGIDNNLIGARSDTKNTQTGIYVDSWNKGEDDDENINAIRDIGILSALNSNTRGFNELPLFKDDNNKTYFTNGNSYALGNNHFSYSVTDDIFVQGRKELMYAFGVNGGGENPTYSGHLWDVKAKFNTGLSVESENSIKVSESTDISVKRVDEEPDLVTFGVNDGTSDNLLLSSAIGTPNNIAGLSIQEINSNQTSKNWVSTEKNRVGSLTATRLNIGSYKPYAISNGEQLEIKGIKENGSSIDVLFEKNIEARFSSQSTGTWLNDSPQSSSIYLNIKRLGGLKSSLGFYESDPLTGAFIYKGSEYMPGDEEYLTNALKLSKSSNLFFGGDSMPAYKEEININDITDFRQNTNYGLLLRVGGEKPVIHSSISNANPSNAVQMIGASSVQGSTTFAFEDISVNDINSDKDYNDLVVTLGAQLTIPYVDHQDNPKGFMIDYLNNNNKYNNFVDLYENSVVSQIRPL